MESELLLHPFPPVWDNHSQILILGTFPSVKSREVKFYYGNPRNRFWAVTASLYGMDVPPSTEEKVRFLLTNGIALWDVVASCRIRGSSDASIADAKGNDVASLLRQTSINRIFTNGKTAKKLYDRLLSGETGMDAVCLPSTSPANASWSLEQLCHAWEVIKS